MMRSPWRIATAVRNPEGEIVVKAFPFNSITKRVKLLGLPVFRGAVGLVEAMKIGIASLNWAAEVAAEEDAKAETIWDKLLGAVFMIVAMALGLGLFMAVPYAVAGLIPSAENQVYFHLVAGTLRICLLLGYMAAISLIPDIKRVFQYHGAEHKSIFAFEKEDDLSVSCAKENSRLHPRCGTSFLLLAAVLTMIGFMLFDSVWAHYFGNFSGVFHRVLVHLPVIPIVAGFSYEVLRIIERHSENPAWRPFVLPGFWLQKITTREPDEDQIEVALAALKESLNKDGGDYEGIPSNDKESVEVK
jgi:uncharacterized protein YqhQ